MTRIIFFLPLLCCLQACNRVDDTKKVVYSNNLESIYGWNKDTKIDQRESHSGRFAAYADSSQIYNLGFRLPLKDVCPSRVYHVHAHVWANCQSLSGNAFLVINLLRNDKNLVYSNVRVENFTTQTGIWYGVSATLDIPEEALADDVLAVYVMNEGADRVWFDDMEIEAIKYK
jgi:hypothetical protein